MALIVAASSSGPVQFSLLASGDLSDDMSKLELSPKSEKWEFFPWNDLWMAVVGKKANSLLPPVPFGKGMYFMDSIGCLAFVTC